MITGLMIAAMAAAMLFCEAWGRSIRRERWALRWNARLSKELEEAGERGDRLAVALDAAFLESQDEIDRLRAVYDAAAVLRDRDPAYRDAGTQREGEATEAWRARMKAALVELAEDVARVVAAVQFADAQADHREPGPSDEEVSALITDALDPSRPQVRMTGDEVGEWIRGLPRGDEP